MRVSDAFCRFLPFPRRFTWDSEPSYTFILGYSCCRAPSVRLKVTILVIPARFRIHPILSRLEQPYSGPAQTRAQSGIWSTESDESLPACFPQSENKSRIRPVLDPLLPRISRESGQNRARDYPKSYLSSSGKTGSESKLPQFLGKKSTLPRVAGLS